jgi:hypothetical protein
VGAIPVAGSGHASVLIDTAHGSILTTGSPVSAIRQWPLTVMVRAVRQRDTHPSDPAKSEDEKSSLYAYFRFQVLLQEINANVVSHSSDLAKKPLQALFSSRPISWWGFHVLQFMDRCL